MFESFVKMFLLFKVNAAKNRRSNCVKEVERLKKNREDRRYFL